MPNSDYMTYDPDFARIQRAQRYAEMLQQQANEPIPIETGGGVQAPISPFSIMAKALQAYSGRKMLEQSDAQYADLQKQRSAKMADLLSNYGKPYQTVDNTPTAQAASDAATQSTGEPLQQYTMATPTAQQNLVQAQNIASTHAPGSDVIGGALSKDALSLMDQERTMQRLAPYYQSIIDKAPPQLQPQLRGALAGGNLKLLDDYGKTLVDKSVPQAVNQATEVTPAQAGVSPSALPPGAHIFQMPDGTYTTKLLSDVESPDKFKQRVAAAAASAAVRQAALAGPATDIPIDPTSSNLSAQTGLSSGALDYMFGRSTTKAAPVIKAYNKEITDWGIKNNVDTSTLRYQAPAIGKVLDQNIVRNNQANILEQEVRTSVENLSPILDSLHRGQLAVANKGGQWVARQMNDQNSLKAADQLNRLTNEIASYNAAAGGHFNVSGAVEPTPKDYEAAASIINSGLNKGGSQAVAQSVSMSAAKNRVVLAKAIDDAKKQQWEMLGLGKRYKSSLPAAGDTGGQAGNADIDAILKKHGL